jgi:septal ring factor EnvC (AmiA/AmiB activator)
VASRRTSTARTLLVVTLSGTALLSVLPTQSSQAEPRPTLQQVQQRIDALNAKIDIADEQYAGSKIALASARRQAAVATARVHAAQARLNAVKSTMGAFAAAAYRTGGTDQFVQLVSTSTPQIFLDRASTLNRIAAGQSAQMAAAATARHRLTTVQAVAAPRPVTWSSSRTRFAATTSGPYGLKGQPLLGAR